MNKKVILIILAVLAFFAGQIFLEKSCAAAGLTTKTFAMFLVPVFELVAGGFIGYFLKKDSDNTMFAYYQDNISTLESKVKSLSEKKESATKAPKTSAKKSTSKE